MIKLLDESYNEELMDFLQNNSIVNYFILQGLEREKYKMVFDKKWGEFDNKGDLISILFKRKTGNMQFFSTGEYNVNDFIELINKEDFKKIIGEKSILNKLVNNYNFSKIKKGSYISELSDSKDLYNIKAHREFSMDSIVKKVYIKDIDRILELYSKVFTGFTPRELIVEKYFNKTGRGYYIEKDGKIISIAQSSYEKKDSAIIVGVATDFEYRNKGLATECLLKLCEELIKEGKKLYLQYDNKSVREIYMKLGFNEIGRMIDCYK
ncbi:MAG: GNAT family N-acetyltransferase [Firmicutes bacterium]|nr:GNAT family N-acetyltransferase [Bacillota bacterium]